MSDIKKFVSDVGVTFFASGIITLLAFPVSILLGRYLGAGELGLYRIVSTIFGLWGIFASFGIPASMIKYVAEFSGNFEKQKKIISSGVTSALILGLTSFILMYVCSGFFSYLFNIPELTFLLKILALVLPFFVLNDVLLGIFGGFREMDKTAGVNIIRSASTLLFTFLLIFDYGVEGSIIAILLSSLLTTALLLYVIKWKYISLENDLTIAKQTIVFGSKTVISNSINVLNYQADILVIGYFLSKYDVGIYSIAVMFGKLIWILPDSIQAVTYPTISELYGRGRHADIKILVDKCMKYSCIFLLLSSSFFVFFGKEFIGFIYGLEFEASYIPLILILVGTAFYGITKSVGSIFASIGKVNLVYKIPLVSGILNLALSVFLVPRYGINGGAIATSFSFIVSTLLMLHFLKILLDIHIDFKWYASIFGITGVLNVAYVIGYLNLPFGLLMMIFQCATFFRFFIPLEDKQKIYNLMKKSSVTG